MGSPRTVLVVDDDDSIREIARVSLEAVAGWEVLTAASAEEALAIAASSSPDAVLLDVMMPGTDGPALVRLLGQRSRTKHIPVIFLTAKVQQEDLRALEAIPGVSGLIAKPFDPMTLAAEVSKLLGWQA